MKKIFILIVLFNVAVFKINAQFIVNDPTSIAQRLFLAVEEMTALIENKYQLVEQVQQMKQIYDQGQEVRDAVQKVASYVKKANEIIEIIEIGEATVADAKRYRREIKNMSNLTDSYKYEAFCLMVNFDTQIVNIIKEAKTIISDKGSDTDAELTDYERIDLLKRIKTQMLNVREVMSVAYTGIFNCDKNIEIDRTVFEAAFGL